MHQGTARLPASALRLPDQLRWHAHPRCRVLNSAAPPRWRQVLGCGIQSNAIKNQSDALKCSAWLPRYSTALVQVLVAGSGNARTFWQRNDYVESAYPANSAWRSGTVPPVAEAPTASTHRPGLHLFVRCAKGRKFCFPVRNPQRLGQNGAVPARAEPSHGGHVPEVGMMADQRGCR